MKYIYIILSFFVGISLFAQDFDKLKIDSLFSIIEKNNKGMGSVSVFQDGKEVYQNSYGYADIEHNIKANSGTKYRIGSISKTFTATVIMKLIEDGELKLSTKLSKFYPQIKNSNKITIENLLQHRSGIFNFTDALDFNKWNDKYISKEQLLNKIIFGGVRFKPGEKFEYSNSNYVLLTFIAETVSKKSIEELYQEIIIGPCGLTNTYPGAKINVNNNEALSYQKLADWKLEKETDMSFALGAGYIVSTPTDLNIFINALFNGKIVNEKSLKLMTSLKDNFGFGLFAVPFYTKTGYGHNGIIDAFQANLYYFQENNMSIAIASNAIDYALNEIVVGVLNIYFGMDYTLPEFKEAIVLKSEDLDKYLGVYSSSSFPLKITISKDGNTLIGQATNQSAFPLECYEDNKFKFDKANLKIEFKPEENKMILKQGITYELRRE